MGNDMNQGKKVSVRTNHLRDPFHSMEHAFGKALDNLFGQQVGSLLPQDWENFLITPSIDVVDEGNNIKVEAEMPGMGPEDITLSITENMLTIKGDKTTSKRDKGKDYVKREINYGSYCRTIALPDNVDADKATANFKKGMLWIVLPKKAGASKKTRQVKIETV